MKGIVLETKDKEAIVLCVNGTVSKIKNRHYEKGQVVKMNNKFKFIAKAGSIAAAFAITAVTSFAYTTPSTYVSLDVNPSIEYELNAFDRVISVVAVNDDGERIVNELDVKNEKITKAVLKTINKLKEQGYLTEDEYAGIVIAVSNKSEEKSDKLANEIEDGINKDENKEDVKTDDGQNVNNEEENIANVEKTDDEDVKKEDDNKDENKEDKEVEESKEDIQIVVESVGRERVEEARKLNVTPGKLNLVQKLIASTDEFDDIDEEQLIKLLKLSVKEINKMTKAYRKGMDVEFIFENDDLDEVKEIEDKKDKDVNANNNDYDEVKNIEKDNEKSKYESKEKYEKNDSEIENNKKIKEKNNNSDRNNGNINNENGNNGNNKNNKNNENKKR